MSRLTDTVAAAQRRLASRLPKGSEVYTVVRSVSRSGMLRRVSVLAVSGDQIIDITVLVAQALGWKLDKEGYLPIRGCGFSVSTHIVGALSYALHQDEYALDPRAIF